MHLVVDGFSLSDGSASRGIGTVVRHVLRGLADDDDFDVEVLAPKGVDLPDRVRRRSMRRLLAHPRLLSREHDLRLPFDLQRAGGDVVWSPAQHPPRRTGRPLVVTLHDLTPLVFPHPLTANDAARWRRREVGMRTADRVVAVSRSSADQGIRLLGLDPSRVDVVPNGVDPVFSPESSHPAGPSYVLFVGAWGPHKGVRDAVAVTAQLARWGLPHRLRIAGPNDDWMAAQLRREIAEMSAESVVDVLGHVDDLPGLYRGASALVFSSRAEGFGLPILEAMACGTPVVGFDNTSIGEVMGDAGLLVPDGDVAQLADAVRAVIEDEALRLRLREAGLRRAALFPWSRTIAGYRRAFLQVAGG